jgi:hypothetical protein
MHIIKAIMKKRLPIGIQTFEKIIDGNFVYVDKPLKRL